MYWWVLLTKGIKGRLRISTVRIISDSTNHNLQEPIRITYNCSDDTKRPIFSYKTVITCTTSFKYWFRAKDRVVGWLSVFYMWPRRLIKEWHTFLLISLARCLDRGIWRHGNYYSPLCSRVVRRYWWRRIGIMDWREVWVSSPFRSAGRNIRDFRRCQWC